MIRKSVQRTFPFLYIIWPFDFTLLLSSVLGNCVRAKARKLYRLLIFTTVLLQLVGFTHELENKISFIFLKIHIMDALAILDQNLVNSRLGLCT